MSYELSAMSCLVTGAAGFIGSEFARQAVKKGYKIIVVDKLTYAGDIKRLEGIKGKYKFYKQDICNKDGMDKIFREERPDIVVHFAAESHVDRSIQDSTPFIETNIKGVQVLLDVAYKHWSSHNPNLSPNPNPHILNPNLPPKRFVHISTDEVYGDIKEGQFYENTPFNPSSPYSASKAAADLLIKSYIRTFDFPAVIVRPSNNYGLWQYPEKFIPVIIYKALKDEKIPVYGNGANIREWLYVSDCVNGIMTVMNKGKLGEVYNIGSGNERKNIDVAKKVLDILKKPYSLIEFVKDRPGHDYRYSLNFSKLKDNLGWSPEVNFDEGLKQTVNWYRNNLDWVEGLLNP